MTSVHQRTAMSLMRQGGSSTLPCTLLIRQAGQTLVRSQSTTTTSTPVDTKLQPSSPLPPPHRRSTEPPSKHKLVYRQIFPPLIRVLAYGSAVYFSLHLVWQYLDGKEQKRLEDEVRLEMEAQVRQKLESSGMVESQGTRNDNSWWSWLSGQ